MGLSEEYVPTVMYAAKPGRPTAERTGVTLLLVKWTDSAIKLGHAGRR